MINKLDFEGVVSIRVDAMPCHTYARKKLNMSQRQKSLSLICFRTFILNNLLKSPSNVSS